MRGVLLLFRERRKGGGERQVAVAVGQGSCPKGRRRLRGRACRGNLLRYGGMTTVKIKAEETFFFRSQEDFEF